MRIESSMTSLSWIPSEAVTGLNRVVFDSGFTHYDVPPPDALTELDQMAAEDRFRFANNLAAWIEVDDAGHVVDGGYCGHSVMGATTVRLGSRDLARFPAVEFPELRAEPERTATSMRFVQTFGGHVALPAPRRVSRPPFMKLEAPTVWTTLALTLHADGTVERELIGASTFPRHWVYDADGVLESKVGLADFKDWWRRAFGKRTPWRDHDQPALVTAVETALERELAVAIMRGGEKPRVRKLRAGGLLTQQGEPGDEVYLLLDGVVDVEVDGLVLAEIGPGAVLGERAVLADGRRTATLRARTAAKVAVASRDQLDLAKLAEVAVGHRREHAVA
jgi:hypothetical protein